MPRITENCGDCIHFQLLPPEPTRRGRELAAYGYGVCRWPPPIPLPFAFAANEWVVSARAGEDCLCHEEVPHAASR